jgi:uncharacterized protein YbcI
VERVLAEASRVANRRGLAKEITKEVIALLREYTGRGPTRAQTVLNHDVVTVVMHETLTKGERKLMSAGKDASVLRTRRDIQDAMRDDLTKMIERLTGRKVVAFLSDNNVRPDVAIEAFILEVLPEPEPLGVDAALVSAEVEKG